jgi:hypothetical protein
MTMNKDGGRQQSNNEHFLIRVVIPVYKEQNSTFFREVMPTVHFL